MRAAPGKKGCGVGTVPGLRGGKRGICMRSLKTLVAGVLSAALCAALVLPATAQTDEPITAVPISAKLTYADVEGTWCKTPAMDYGALFVGDDGLFHPNQSTTRMEFARLLHQVLGIQINYFAATDIGTYFDDVSNSDTGAGDLYDLATLGIVDDTGAFRPSDALTRQEMVHYTMNALRYSADGAFRLPMIAALSFADDAQISDAYRLDVAEAVTKNLVNGVGSNYFRPLAPATRAQAVTVAGRLADWLAGYRSGVDITASAAEKDGALELTLSVHNHTDKAISFTHSSGQLFDFVLFDAAGNELYRWSDGMAFTMMVGTTELAAGEIRVFTETVDAQTYASIKDKIASARGYLTGTSSNFSIDADGYAVIGAPWTK